MLLKRLQEVQDAERFGVVSGEVVSSEGSKVAAEADDNSTAGEPRLEFDDEIEAESAATAAGRT